MLEQECAAAGGNHSRAAPAFRKSAPTTVSRSRTDRGDFSARSLVIATGGLSIPKMGATPFGYQVAQQFGLRMQPCRPALVPLTFAAEDLKRYADLAGVSTEVVALQDRAFSGKTSLYSPWHQWAGGAAGFFLLASLASQLEIDLAPDQFWTGSLRAQTSQRDLSDGPICAAQRSSSSPGRPLAGAQPPAAWTNRGLDRAESALHRWTVYPAGTEGYEKAEVTAGGVDTDELSARTMECRESSRALLHRRGSRRDRASRRL